VCDLDSEVSIDVEFIASDAEEVPPSESMKDGNGICPFASIPPPGNISRSGGYWLQKFRS
jgi:hypothetical protein